MPSAFVGTDITDEIELITNNKGSTVLFYQNYKYLKSGESKTSLQYRCVNYMKKCRSRIIFNRDNETAMKNEIMHNHEADPAMYETFYRTAALRRRFGRYKEKFRLGKSECVDDDAEKCE